MINIYKKYFVFICISRSILKPEGLLTFSRVGSGSKYSKILASTASTFKVYGSVTPNLDLDLRVAGTGAGVFWLEPEFSPGSGSYFSVI